MPGLPSAVLPPFQFLDLKTRHCDGGIVTLEKIFESGGRYPLKPNDLVMGIRAHLDTVARQHPQESITAVKIGCASCGAEFQNLRLMMSHRRESHDNN